MKSVLLATAILMSLSSVVSASEIDDNIKKQCQYLLFGSGVHDTLAITYMYGVIDGQSFQIKEKDKSDFYLRSNNNSISKRACKEAFSDNSADDFSDKFLWGVAVTIDKEHTHLRKVK